MSNYIYLTSSTTETKFGIDYYHRKNTGYSAIRTLQGLHHLKTVDPNKVINKTNLSIDQLAQQVLENYENKFCIFRKIIDNFLQYFIDTKRGKVYQTYQQILKSSPVLENQITQVKLPAFMVLMDNGLITPEKLFKILLEEEAKLKALEFQSYLTKIEKDLSTFESLIQKDSRTNSIARLKALFNVAKSMKTICENLEQQFSSLAISSEKIIEIENIKQNLDCMLMYLSVYIETYGTPRDKKFISFSIEGNELLNQFRDQILQAVARNKPD